MNLAWDLYIAFKFKVKVIDKPQGPTLTNFNDKGDSTRVHILYPKKSQLQNLSTPKNHYFFLLYPKKSLSPFFTTPKNPSVFLQDPKKSWHLSLASNAAALFPSPWVPSLGKKGSADYKRRIVFHTSAQASTFV